MMRLTVAEVSYSNLEHNLAFIKDYAGRNKIMAVVKANAYGHGIVEIARHLINQGIDMLGVAFADEGVLLRKAGLNSSIFVLIPESDTNAEICVNFDLIPVVSSLDFLFRLNEEAKKANKQVFAHLFVNTGMNREGIKPDSVLEFMQKTVALENVNINGICTHFATASSHIVFARQQLDVFNEAIELLGTNGFNFEQIHASNSAAAILLPESQFNIIRPGLLLYGYPPTEINDANFDVKPLMTIRTKVVSVRKINKGDTVGYGMNYIAEKSTNAATIPMGYGDGYFRAFTNRSEVLIKGKRYRLIGTVCMDSCTIDIGNDEINENDEVVVLGCQGNDIISAFELSDIAHTIPYEITTAISERVPRVYID